MGKKKQNTPSKNTTKNKQMLWDANVAKYPEIFEYFQDFENNKKHLMLLGVNEIKLPAAIRKYIFEEMNNREVIRQYRYDLLIYKVVDCLNKDDDDLYHKICEDLTYDEGYITELIRGVFAFIPEGIKHEFTSENHERVERAKKILHDIEGLVRVGCKQKEKETISRLDYEIVGSGRDYKNVILTGNGYKNVADRIINYLKVKIPEESIIKFIANDFNSKFTKCEILFLYDISSKNNVVWESLTTELRRTFPKYKPNFVLAEIKKGANVEDLPPGFTKMFKVISLYSEAEVTLPESTVREIKGEEKDVPAKAMKIVHFPTPSGTEWSDVEITFIDNEHVRIKVKGKVIKPRAHYSEMGFKHETAAQPIKLWEETLRAFAVCNGIITPKFDKKGNLVKTVSVDDVKRLRTKLRDCFGISDNPIPRYDKGKYIKGEDEKKEFVKGEGYKTAFCIKDESSLQDTINKNRSD